MTAGEVRKGIAEYAKKIMTAAGSRLHSEPLHLESLKTYRSVTSSNA